MADPATTEPLPSPNAPGEPLRYPTTRVGDSLDSPSYQGAGGGSEPTAFHPPLTPSFQGGEIRGPGHETHDEPAVDSSEAPTRSPCPAPANFRKELEHYDASARVGTWAGPRYKMTYRELGEGPPLIVCPGIASTYRVYALLLNRLADRFRTILYDYPGEHRGDGARLDKITHEDLTDDVFGLIDHLNIGRVFLLGISFGSTVTLRALHREPRRFPKAALQGGFAQRSLSAAERLAFRFGRLIPGTVAGLPLRKLVLNWNQKAEFPALLADRWTVYVEENSRTRIAPLAHRLDLLGRTDLRPLLPQIPTELLLIQGNEDRLVPRRYYDELLAGLPNARGLILPTVGHQPQLTHAEVFAAAATEFFLPCAPEGCPQEKG